MKECIRCKTKFEVDGLDRSFLDKVSPRLDDKKLDIPEPTHCPTCRQIRRLSHRNERTLYFRECDFNQKKFLSHYSPDSDYKVYSPDVWYGDDWDASEYGRDYDFTKPFFSQFEELFKNVPQLGLNLQKENENCQYTNFTTRNKNSYYIFCANENEDCHYSTYLHHCKDVADCFFVFNCERCYECIDCYNCYNTTYSNYCTNCNDSHYLVNCKGLNDCIGCVSLANKEYHIFNKAYSKKEYLKLKEDLLLKPELIKSELEKLLTTTPQKYYAGLQNENITGDHISYSRNVFDSFDCTNLEDCRYCTWLHDSKDCQDCYAWGSRGELGYENHLCGNNFYRVIFSDTCWNDVSNLIYCRQCIGNCKYLFGCVGMKKKEFCILNKQYTEQEYHQLVPKIIEHMKDTKEWGEFFPTELSPFGYNETVAEEYFPKEKSEVLDNCWKWQDNFPESYGKETISIDDIPDEPSQYLPSLSREVLSCSCCGKNYRLTSAEIKLYKELGIKIPSKCFDCRYEGRRIKRNQRKLVERSCDSCSKTLLSSFKQNDPRKVYCEECYLAHVY